MTVPDATGKLWQISPRLISRRGENDEGERALKGGEKVNGLCIVKPNWLLKKPDTELTGQLLAKVTGHTAEVKAWGPTFQ